MGRKSTRRTFDIPDRRRPQSAGVEVGARAPDFSLSDERGQTARLHRILRHHRVILIFYPGDMTPGCTRQLCAIRDDQREFERHNTTVLGINHANRKSHQRFKTAFGLTARLLVDSNRTVAKRYGATRSFFGRTVTSRTVFIVGQDGIVRFTKRGLPSDQELLTVLGHLGRKGGAP